MYKLIPLLIFIIGSFSIHFVMAGSGMTGVTTPSRLDTKTGTISSYTGKTLESWKKYTHIHKSYDALPFYDDTSIYRFVSKDRPLTDKKYAPNDLEYISGTYIRTSGRSWLALRREARDALWDMAQAFEQKFAVPLTVISTYRSAAYQQRMWDLGKCSDTLCAPAWYSEHQLGLAIDIFDATTADDYEKNFNYRRYIAWMKKNAHLYGWHQSYQKGEKIDAYEIEPWHWRYLWVDMATKLHNLGWTYTEYVKFQEVLAKRY